MKKFLAVLILFMISSPLLADQYADDHKAAKETTKVWVVLVSENW
jgi:hypothetical protein